MKQRGLDRVIFGLIFIPGLEPAAADECPGGFATLAVQSRDNLLFWKRRNWIPAFAGMTKWFVLEVEPWKK